MDAYLRSQLPETPPKRRTDSPFKVTSSSTPKDRHKRPPLRERQPGSASGPRRRLDVSLVETSSCHSKDDSAIGLNASLLSSSPPSTASQSSSNASSPDSGNGDNGGNTSKEKKELKALENLEEEIENVKLEEEKR